ncbi:unnamed protein product [Phaedon cochleariae]|uniref:Uncharacterized protein n=1 Tax=Phaedon cochleariae TaxID=80249 RepID=A0A9N9SKS1_PHACE|nr:unnamed protein product [Phaedon cochleariae]
MKLQVQPLSSNFEFILQVEPPSTTPKLNLQVSPSCLTASSNFKFNLQVQPSSSNFKLKLQVETSQVQPSSSTFKFKLQVESSSSTLKLNLQVQPSSSTSKFNSKRVGPRWVQNPAPSTRWAAPRILGGGIQTARANKPARDQTGTPEHTTGIEEITNPFAKRSVLQRSPIIQRTCSLSDLGSAGGRGQSENIYKRKKFDFHSEEKQDLENQGAHFMKVVERMCQQIKLLEVIVKDAYKPKKEFQEISGKLALQVEKLQNHPSSSNFELNLQVQPSSSNFKFNLQVQTSSSTFKLKPQVEPSSSQFKLNLQVQPPSTTFKSNFKFKLQVQPSSSTFMLNLQVQPSSSTFKFKLQEEPSS